MAGRPAKVGCEYFSHDSDMRNHRKVKAIRKKFPNGYAIWCMFLEYLTAKENNKVQLDDTEYELLSGDFDYESDEIKAVIEYAIKLQMLFEKDGFVFSESLNERLKPVYEKRKRDREYVAQRERNVKGVFVSDNVDDNSNSSGIIGSDNSIIGNDNAPINPQSKVKYNSSSNSTIKLDSKHTLTNSYFLLLLQEKNPNGEIESAIAKVLQAAAAEKKLHPEFDLKSETLKIKKKMIEEEVKKPLTYIEKWIKNFKPEKNGENENGKTGNGKPSFVNYRREREELLFAGRSKNP